MRAMVARKTAVPADSGETQIWWVRAALVCVLVGLTLAACYTSLLIVERQAALQRVSRYNVTWLASQASTELVRFQERVVEFALPGGEVDQEEVQLRLDVLANRVTLLRSGEAGELIRADPVLAGIVAKLDHAIAEADGLLPALEQTGVRQRVLALLDPLVTEIARLAATTNRQGGDMVAKDQHDLSRLHWMFSGLLIGVFICAVTQLVFVNWIRNRFVLQLLTAKDVAEAASMAKSRFLANMSHELRTPMNGVLGMVELIRQGHLSSEQRRFAEVAHQSGKAMLDLIAAILDHSRIEAGRLELREGPLDIHAVVNEAAGLARAEATMKGLTLSVGIAPGVPSGLLGDAGRLRQIVAHLVGNAIKFTNAGSIAVTVALTGHEAGIAALRFEVRDSGIGIAADQLPKLFQAFSQADDSSTRQRGGTGLGLAIARQLVELMGGTIGADSRPEEGSTFWFTVRLRCQPKETKLETRLEAAPEAAPEAECDPDCDPAPIAGLSVLLVTADNRERDLMLSYLSPWAITPVHAATAEQAVALARRARALGHGFDQALVWSTPLDAAGDALADTMRRDPSLRGLTVTVIGGEPGGGGPNAGPRLPHPVPRARLYEELRATAHGRTLETPPPPSAAGMRDDGMRDGAAAIQPPPAAPETPDSIHALLVEDNPINRLVASEYLKRAGCAVDLAVHGREAVDRCRRNTYDIVFMDCQMPEMDGLEATRVIRHEQAGAARRMPIVALTANAMDMDRDQCLAAGMDDFLTKPANQDAIAEALRRWIPPPRRALVRAR